MKAVVVKLLGSFFGVGFLPWAPGTWGSLAALAGWFWLVEALRDNPALANLLCAGLFLFFALATLALGGPAERLAGAEIPPAMREPAAPGSAAADRMGPFKRALSAARRLPLAGFRPPGTDPAWFVLDELAGAFLALYGLARYNPEGSGWGWWWAGASFLLFRALDVTKVGAIGWADRRLKGAVGILLDDLFAGAAANLTIRGLHWLLTGQI